MSGTSDLTLTCDALAYDTLDVVSMTSDLTADPRDTRDDAREACVDALEASDTTSSCTSLIGEASRRAEEEEMNDASS